MGPTTIGEPVRVCAHKWPDGDHWEFDARWLGSDEHGDWVGIVSGTEFTRPAATFVAVADHVTLLPDSGWYAATFYDTAAPQRPFDVYVDIGTPVTWSREPGGSLAAHSVDLDLDVIRGTRGRVWVDDEDEFAEHRVRLGYPDDVVEGALRSCREVLDDVRRSNPPYDARTPAGWLDRLSDLSGR